MQRIMRVAAWLAPSSGAVLTAVLVTYRWFGSRASLEDVGAKVGEVSGVAAAAQQSAHHAASLADGHAIELHAMWMHIVTMRAELSVLRAYSKLDAKTRGEYVDKAQAFYTLRFDEQLRQHANDPALAAELALKSEWRPDR